MLHCKSLKQWYFNLHFIQETKINLCILTQVSQLKLNVDIEGISGSYNMKMMR